MRTSFLASIYLMLQNFLDFSLLIAVSTVLLSLLQFSTSTCITRAENFVSSLWWRESLLQRTFWSHRDTTTQQVGNTDNDNEDDNGDSNNVIDFVIISSGLCCHHNHNQRYHYHHSSTCIYSSFRSARIVFVLEIQI